MVTGEKASSRRDRLRDALLLAAEQMIEREGVRGLRARALADEVGCAVGAIYNVVSDLDDLILAVNSRTLSALEARLQAAETAETAEDADAAPIPRAISRLVRLALAYLDFAAEHKLRWRALFDHRLPPGRTVPDWYRGEQERLFAYVDEPLRALQPDCPAERRALLARSLFSAVHGLVVLGLEEKLQLIPLAVLREQMVFVVTATGRGLTSA
jgi:AcrR family transcriptional regulator